MSTDQILKYVLIAIVIIVIVVVAILIRRSRIKLPLEDGWQFYFAPTTLDPPGTIFRIDSNQHRYTVETLKVKLHVGEEVVGEYKGSLKASLGILAKLLNVKGVDLKAQTSKSEELVFKMDRPMREVVEDQDLDPVLKPFLEKLDYRVDNRYFVIRECRKSMGLTHKITSQQLDNLGGKASLADLLALDGTLFKSNKKDEFLIEKTFTQPMRVMYLPDEITPISSGLAASKPELGRAEVHETLEWE